MALADRLFKRADPVEDSMPLTRDEMLQGGRAIYDSVMERLEKHLAGFELQLVKTLEERFDRRVAYTNKSLNERLTEVDQRYGNALEQIDTVVQEVGRRPEVGVDEMGVALRIHKMVRDHLDKEIQAIEARQDERRESDRALILERFEEVKALHVASLEAIKSLIGNMPVPQVILPDEAIVVKQLPSIVNLPEGAIVVRHEVKQLPSVVNISQKAAQVNFPEKALQVNVQAKAIVEKTKTTTTKSIVYDSGSGRPSQIVETVE